VGLTGKSILDQATILIFYLLPIPKYSHTPLLLSRIPCRCSTTRGTEEVPHGPLPVAAAATLPGPHGVIYLPPPLRPPARIQYATYAIQDNVLRGPYPLPPLYGSHLTLTLPHSSGTYGPSVLVWNAPSILIIAHYNFLTPSQ
jgi:hypothetical protein